MRFSQSSVMMMDTSPVHRIWHAKARYARFLTLPTARVIHIPPAQHAGFSLAGWTRPSFASSEGGGAASGRQHTLPNNPEVCEIALGMAELRFSKFILPSNALMHLFLFKMYFLLETLCLTTTTTR
jgi:hypothetical protein